MINRTTYLVIAVLLLVVAILIIVKRGSLNAMSEDNISSYLKLDGIDSIRIVFWPNGEEQNKKRERLVDDREKIASLISELKKIPAKGPGRRAKLDSRAPEYQIDFIKNKNILATLRIKAEMLDSPFGYGWDFYDTNIDKKFVSLVKSLMETDR